MVCDRRTDTHQVITVTSSYALQQSFIRLHTYDAVTMHENHM